MASRSLSLSLSLTIFSIYTYSVRFNYIDGVIEKWVEIRDVVHCTLSVMICIVMCANDVAGKFTPSDRTTLFPHTGHQSIKYKFCFNSFCLFPWCEKNLRWFCISELRKNFQMKIISKLLKKNFFLTLYHIHWVFNFLDCVVFCYYIFNLLRIFFIWTKKKKSNMTKKVFLFSRSLDIY